MLGYLPHTVEYRLEFVGCEENWEDLVLETQCDAAFGVTSHGGHKLRLKGDEGSRPPLTWSSKRIACQTTNSTETETLEWGQAAETTIKVAAVIIAARIKPIKVHGLVDNDALRLAVIRGSSAKLGHLRVHGERCFRFLAQSGILMGRIPGEVNAADMLTEVLSAQRLRYLCAVDFGLTEAAEPDFQVHGEEYEKNRTTRAR